MSPQSSAQVARAQRLLAMEGASSAAAEVPAAAAGAVYDKLDAQLSPLLGEAGFRALLARCAKLSRGEHACLADAATVQSSAKLRVCLQALDPAQAAEAAEALFGAFFTLITTLIGERLTAQILRRAWPEIEEAAPMEAKK